MPDTIPCARTEVLELLTPALVRVDISPKEVDDEFNIIDRGVVDSLGFLDLIANLETRIGAELDLFDADPDALTTVGGLASLVRDAMARQTHSSLAESDR